MGRLDKERVSRSRGITNGQKRALHGVSLLPIHCKGRADCNTHTTQHYTTLVAFAQLVSRAYTTTAACTLSPLVWRQLISQRRNNGTADCKNTSPATATIRRVEVSFHRK